MKFRSCGIAIAALTSNLLSLADAQELRGKQIQVTAECKQCAPIRATIKIFQDGRFVVPEVTSNSKSACERDIGIEGHLGRSTQYSFQCNRGPNQVTYSNNTSAEFSGDHLVIT